MEEPHIIIVDPPKKRKPLVNRLLRRVLWTFAIAFGLLMLTSVVIAAFFEKQIGDQLISEINKQLKTELTVESFELSLLSGFPKVSANLKGVVLADAMKGNLLEAENISFRFGLLSLLSSRIQVNSVLIEGGALYVKRDRKGRVNYDIVKSSEAASGEATSSEEQELGISLEEASFRDVELIYEDARARQELRILLNSAELSGEFSSQEFEMSSFAEMKSEFIELDRERYFVGKQLVYDARVKVDFKKGIYLFENVDVGIAENIFKVDGSIKEHVAGMDYDLKVSSNEGSIEAVLGLLPATYQNYFRDFKSKGTFHFNAAIKGLLNARQNPSVQARFGLQDGQISSARLGKALKDVTFTARFNNGKSNNNKTSTFEIADFRAYLDRESVAMQLKIDNLDDPRIDFSLNGTLPLASIYGLFDQPNISQGEGKIEFKDLILKGRVKDMLNPRRVSRVKTGGMLEFDDAGLTINNETLIFDRGQVRLQDNSLIVEDVRVEGAGSELLLSGNFLNVIPVLFADSVNSQRAELRFQAQLDASNLDLDRIVQMTQVQVEESEVQKAVYDSLRVAQTQKRAFFTNFLNGTFQAKIEAFNYREIEAQDFTGSLEFDNSILKILGNTQAMDGRFNLDGTAFFEDEPRLEARIICDDIDVREFFRQGENFGQEVLQYKHVKGRLEAKLAVNAYWDREGRYQNDRLKVFGDVSIKDGELVNFKMLYDFSDYIKIKDLQRIKFTNMRNWLEVSKEKVHIPAMFLQSNALNMTISGQHSFENDIDYSIKVNAGQVLWNKLRKYDPNRKPQPAKKKGWFNLYYRIWGTVDDYDMKSDKRAAKKRFRLSENRKKEIQAALIKAFGRNQIDLSDEPSDWNDDDNIPEYQGGESGDDEFLDFEVEGQSSDEEEEFMWEEEEGGGGK